MNSNVKLIKVDKISLFKQEFSKWFKNRQCALYNIIYSKFTYDIWKKIK
ncbi:MAG: hypothetical protein RR290_04185 [Clostridia bacterium]